MSDGYQVDPAVLRQHAGSVGAIAGRLEHAADAANEEGIGGAHPYGLLFSPIAVPVLGTVAALAKTMITETGTLGRGIEKSLKTNVDLYELVEKRITDSVRKVFQ